jgi:hypothetical protein
MAIPRGYRRGSGGFLQPIGSRPSGLVSGPGHGLAPIGEGETYGINPLTKEPDYRPASLKRAQAKVLASFEKAQKRHEGVMDKIRKADADTFKRLNDALNASKESDPKDKLGNTVPSAQTQYLERQLIGHLASSGLRNDQAASPAKAGITPEQERGAKERPGGPGGGRYDVGGSEYIPGVPGSSDLLNRRQGLSLEPGDATDIVPLPGGKALRLPDREPEIFPIDTPAKTTRGDTVILKGQTRKGPNGPEYLVETANGKEAWIPRANFEVAEAPDQGRGLVNLRRFYEKPTEDFQPF